MTTIVSYTGIDFSDEKSVMSFPTEQLLPDGSNLTAINVTLTALTDALFPITRMVAFQQKKLSDITRGTNNPSTDPEAQREEKWYITFEDVTEWLDDPVNTIPNPGFRKIYGTEIPMADLSLRDNNSEVVYTQAGGGVDPLFDTFVTAFNNAARSVNGGNVVVVKIHSVGRNI